MQKVRVGVVGVGHLGQHHARNYGGLSDCQLIGVADVDRKAAARVASAYHTKPFFDHRDLIGKVDAVSIVVPTIYHYQTAKDFLNAGVHVLVEKPITNEASQARELINLEKEKRLILQVGHIERFNVAVQHMRKILDRPGFIECHRLGPYEPRVKDVGVVLDLMIHDIDIVLQMVDSPIASIEAVGVPILSPREDIANARIVFENGCTANLTVSRVTPNKLRKIRIFQADAYISLDYQNQAMEIYTREAIEHAGPGEPKAQIVRKVLRLKKEEPLRAELAHFIECVRKGEEPQVTGEHGHDALQVAIRVTDLINEKQSKIQEIYGSGI